MLNYFSWRQFGFFGVLLLASIAGYYQVRVAQPPFQWQVIALSACDSPADFERRQQASFTRQLAFAAKGSRILRCPSLQGTLRTWLRCYTDSDFSTSDTHVLLLDGCAHIEDEKLLIKSLTSLEESGLANLKGQLVFENSSWLAFEAFTKNSPPTSRTILLRRGVWDAVVRSLDMEAIAKGLEFWQAWAFTGVDLLAGTYKNQNFEMPHVTDGKRLDTFLLESNLSRRQRSILSYAKRRSSPIVSVITPTFNFCHSKWFCQHLESLLQQSLQDFEYILVNDGSTVHCAVHRMIVANDFGTTSITAGLYNKLCDGNSKSKNVIPTRVVGSTENEGLASARNIGAMAAKAPYIYFLDPDDLLAPTALEKLVLLGAMVIGRPVEHYPHRLTGYLYSGTVHFGANVTRPHIAYSSFDVKKLAKGNFLTSAALIGRRTFLEAGGNCERNILHTFEDWDFYLRLAALGIYGRLLREPLFYYRRHSYGQSSLLASTQSSDQSREEIRLKNPSIYGDIPEALVKGSAAIEGYRTALSDRLPCYKPLNYERGKSMELFSSRIIQQVESPVRVLYLVPMLVAGGATLYDIHVLMSLYGSKRCHITLVVERHLDVHVWHHYFARYSHEIWFLQTMTNNTVQQVDIINHLLISRDISTIVVGRSSVGYDFLSMVCKKRVKVYSVLHMMESSAGTVGWEMRAASVAEHINVQLVPSMKLAVQLKNFEQFRRFAVVKASDILGALPEGRAIVVLPPALDLTQSPVRVDNLKLTTGSKVLVFCGRFTDQKDPLLWLQVAHEIALTSDISVDFLMIGDGPLRHKVTAWIRDRQLEDKFFLVGELSHAETISLLERVSKRATILVTSVNEGTPLAVMESLALGLQLVSLYVGAITEVTLDALEGVSETSVPQTVAEGYQLFIKGPCSLLNFSANFSKRLLVDTVARQIRNSFSNTPTSRELLKMYQEKFHLNKFNAKVKQLFNVM